MHHQDPAGSRQHPQHDQHDPALIAGLAADDLTPVERSRAQALTDACTECRALQRDLLAIADAARTLPRARAPRDFRITADQASSLRRRSWLATLLAPFAGARSATRPMATAFTTLGLAGLFVAAVVPGMLGGTASMAAPEGAGAPAFGAGATEAPVPQLGPAAPSDDQGGFGTKDNADASQGPGSAQSGGGEGRDLDSTEDGRLDAPAPANLLLVGSAALLAAGLLLFGLRLAARRLR